ncbi:MULTISPECIES: regulatory protein GemA [Hyphomicrobiales]|jgi:hypothetical protein|uniref:regulatory protein GemA n=1 Tax=Methylobacterium sp. CCH7-A2 TaxID=1768789 RepID=UPI00083002AC|nr:MULTISPECIES: regulatory protein GemA [Hyphomicrobiales]
MITGKQIAMIQAAKRQLGLSEDEYRGLVRRIGQADSARDLTPAGFTALIRAFETLGFQRTNPPLHVRRGMATPAQLALIEQLWRQWSGDENAGAMRAWIERSYKISALRFMTKDHAAMAINALRVMNRRKAFHDAQAKKPSGAA